MSDQVDRSVLPIRRPPFAGVAEKTLGGSRPDWGLIGHVKPEYRERYLGIKIPPTNLQEYHLEEAWKFVDGLASRLPASTSEHR